MLIFMRIQVQTKKYMVKILMMFIYLNVEWKVLKHQMETSRNSSKTYNSNGGKIFENY